MLKRSLTGEWRGTYQQNQARHGMVAVWVQEGERISGTMRDLETVFEQSLYDAVASAGLPPGSDEKIDEAIRDALPGAEKGPIISRSTLPEESTVEGRVSGVFVNFTKRYQGESMHEYVIGEQGIRRSEPAHAVEYRGRLSEDGEVISGQWMIVDAGLQHGRLEGLFELRRAERIGKWLAGLNGVGERG